MLQSVFWPFVAMLILLPTAFTNSLRRKIKIHKRISMPGIKRRAADAKQKAQEAQEAPEESWPVSEQKEEGDRRRFAAAVTAAHFPALLPGRCAFRSYPPYVLDPSCRLARCSSYRRGVSKRHTFVSYAPSGPVEDSTKILRKRKLFDRRRDSADYSRTFTFHLQSKSRVIKGQMHAVWSTNAWLANDWVMFR